MGVSRPLTSAAGLGTPIAFALLKAMGTSSQVKIKDRSASSLAFQQPLIEAAKCAVRRNQVDFQDSVTHAAMAIEIAHRLGVFGADVVKLL